MVDFRVFMKLLLVMMAVSLGAIGITTSLLYYDALKGREEVLTQVAARYRRAITAVGQQHEIHLAEKIGEHPEGHVKEQLMGTITRAAALTGVRGDIEIAVAVLKGDLMHFITLRVEGKEPHTIRMGSNIAIPMQLAMQGKTGTIRSLDYKGDRVLAAYTQTKKFKIGIVAKSATGDINFRFIKGSVTAVAPAVFLVLLGAWYFYRTTGHIVERLRSDNLKFRRMANKLEELNNALAESEQRLKCFFDAAFEGIVITADGVFIDCNQRFADMFGYTVEELIGMPVSGLVYSEDLPIVEKHIAEEYLNPYEHRSVDKNGKIVYCEVHGQTGYLKGRKVRITAIHNLAERYKSIAAIKELAARKQHQSKMEAIGNFASGIAHDFNNALQPIIGNCELLALRIKQGDHADPDECQANVNKILTAAETAQQLVKRIQTFTRKDPPPVEIIPLKVDACIEEAFEFLRSITPTSIHMEMHMEPNLGMVSTTDVMIRQVLMNLVKNASHAIGDDQGTIRIEVSNDVIRVERWGLTAGEYVKIEIEDNGCGMPEEVLEQALDPYFTTKDEEGTGLGLAVVHGILNTHKGLIHLQSEEGLGTKATVYLPVIDGAQGTHDSCNLDDPVALGDHQRIIFVDDETSIINMAQAVLTSLQYDVVVFFDSTKALREIRLNPKAYDCLMTDLTMPDLDGIELIREAKKVNPELKVILSSGFGTNGRSRADLYGDLINIYLHKPVTRREYARVLSELFSV